MIISCQAMTQRDDFTISKYRQLVLRPFGGMFTFYKDDPSFGSDGKQEWDGWHGPLPVSTAITVQPPEYGVSRLHSLQWEAPFV